MDAEDNTQRGVVLRVGELFLKGGNRHVFMNALIANVKRALKGYQEVSVTYGTGRILIKGSDSTLLLEKLRWVFGISSYSPVVFCRQNIDSIKATAIELAKQYQGSKETTFRISAKRADKTFNHTSSEIAIKTGSAVNEATGYIVDLEQPDLNIGIEVAKNWTFLWTQKLPAGGGLPVGTSGKAMLLLSGGIDSPVAGHLLQKRGLSLACIYFHAFPYTSDGAREKVIRLAEILASRQNQLKLYVIPFAKVQETFKENVNPSYLVLLYRRAMIRIAEKVAQKEKIKALATGENLGQVASQTLENMIAVEEVASLPLLRPLITMDKIETINISKQIGTYDISILPYDDCCTLFVPKHPETKGSLKVINKFEALSPYEQEMEEALNKMECITF
jgi:thiamine biosynthesis protein ThiI